MLEMYKLSKTQFQETVFNMQPEFEADLKGTGELQVKGICTSFKKHSPCHKALEVLRGIFLCICKINKW